MRRSQQEYLDKLVAQAEEWVRLLSNPNKSRRECMVCRAFLRCIGETFSDGEILAARPEPVDVAFREARFQLCDHLSPDYRRVDEAKRTLARRKAAQAIDDVTEPVRWPKPMTLAELLPAIVGVLDKKARKYGPAQCGDLDALVCVGLEGRFLSPDSHPVDVGALEAQGWRSVSIVFPPYGVVLFAREGAPGFLRERVGVLLREWNPPFPDRLFEP